MVQNDDDIKKELNESIETKIIEINSNVDDRFEKVNTKIEEINKSMPTISIEEINKLFI